MPRGRVNRAKEPASTSVFAFANEKALAMVPCEDAQLAALIDGAHEEEREHIADNRFRDLILPLLELIPPREADCVELYFVARKCEADIAKLFGCSQGNVSYILRRATRRLKFLVELPKIDDAEVERLLRSTDLDSTDVAVLLDYRHTTQQSATAKRLGFSQGRVHYRICRACARLSEWAESQPELRDVATMMCMYRDNPGILARQLGRWASKA